MDNLMKTLIIIIFMINSISVNAQSQTTDKPAAAKLHLQNDMTLPPCDGMENNLGVAGAFSGIIDNNLVIIGGANFPKGYPWEGGKKVWWKNMYRTSLSSQNQKEWYVADNFMPHTIAYGVSIQLDNGFLCIGGSDDKQCHTDVVYIKEEDGKIVADTDSFPSLPVPLANTAGVVSEDKIYLMGGQSSIVDEASTKHCFFLDLRHLEKGWQSFPAWQGESRAYAVSVAQAGKIYLFSGRSFASGQETVMHTDAHVYDPIAGKWEILQGEFPVMAGTAIPYGESEIIFLGGVGKILPTTPGHPGFSRAINTYDVHTNILQKMCDSPYPIAVTTNVAVDGNSFYITSGEVKPGIRTPNILKGEFGSTVNP